MNELFGEFDLSNPESDDAATVEKRKLDMFTDVLPNIGNNNFQYYNNLDDANKKLYQAYTIMKWVSCTPNNQHQDFLINVNEFVNIDFWSITKHPSLQHQMLCIANALSAGSSTTRHSWVPFLKTTKKKSTINDFFRNINPSINDQEIEILKSQYSNDDFEKLVKLFGMQDSDVKRLVKAWKDETK